MRAAAGFDMAGLSLPDDDPRLVFLRKTPMIVSCQVAPDAHWTAVHTLIDTLTLAALDSAETWV